MAESVGIAGSGVIACGLAAVASEAGEVVLWARSDASAQRCRGALADLCGRLDGAAAADRIRVVTELEALADRSFVIEAIAEDLAVKSELLGRLAVLCPGEAILATTTSSLSVAALASASGAPERVVGLHVFNPVPRMALVELVFGEAVGPVLRGRTHALCERLGKTAIEVPDIPGFVVNRLLFPYLFSAVELMTETGLTAEAIDTAMTLGAGHPMGPLALLDLVGLDVACAIADAIGVPVPERLRTLVAEGRLGRKSGSGLTL